MDELDKQWIWKDTSGSFNGLSLTHRFGLQQKKKVRVIDNFKTSGVNATCGMPEKQKLYGLDFIANNFGEGPYIDRWFAGLEASGENFRSFFGIQAVSNSQR